MKSPTGDYNKYGDPEDHFQLTQALNSPVLQDTSVRLKRRTQTLLRHGKSDCFILLPVEVRLMVLCFLPTGSVVIIRQLSDDMDFLPV